MKTRISISILIPVVTMSLLSPAFAQSSATTTPGKPRFVTLPPKPATSAVRPAATLPTWNGSFNYGGQTYNFNMVGTNPIHGAPTTVPVFIIPIKMVITSATGGTTTYDPAHVLTNGKTVIQNIVASPIFDSTTTYVQGGTNVGTTQYIDAYQRANFWGVVSNNPNYHLLLGQPHVLPEVTLNPPVTKGTTGQEFGFKAAKVDINWFDAKAQQIISSITQIQPNAFPIFVTYNTYLTEFRIICCIGGYHSAVGPQAYAHATYVDVPGAFAQDVSALSHEVGEWADDPLVNNSGNPVACGILENGDPLESNPNYGGYPYTVNGFQYNLQDLVTLPYFGAPPAISVNHWFTFQGETIGVCSNGG